MTLSAKAQTQKTASVAENGTSQTNGLQARLIAMHLLDQVLHKKLSLDDVIARDSDFRTLPDRDRGFARMLSATTLRRMRQIDALILRASNHGEMPRPQRLHDVLRIGLTQVFFMDVPDHAAVDTTVRLAREKQRGFVNAVMRRMVSEGREWLKEQDDAMNMPPWLYDRWVTDYGEETAGSIARASLSEASLDITVKHENEMALWAGSLEAVKLPSGSLRRESGGRIDMLEGFQNGSWWVQDASSALPARLFGDEIEGQRVIDLCAAPGGKTAQLAAMGAYVTAVDRSAARMKRLHENLERLKLADRVDAVVSDGSIWQPTEKVDYVLLDAPCTATGTIRRHPDILHLKDEGDQERLESIQRRLLRNAANILNVGGTLIYCTCSLQKGEGEEQVLKFLSENQNFEIVPILSSVIGGARDVIDENGFARVLPFHMATHGGMDGFFIARLRKI